MKSVDYFSGGKAGIAEGDDMNKHSQGININTEDIKNKCRIYETDVLIVGAGLGGSYGALAASDKGVKVILVEKANARRSGSAAVGIDNMKGIFRDEFSDPDETAENFAREYVELSGKVAKESLQRIVGEEMIDRVLTLEKIGIPIRDKNGRFLKSPLGAKHDWVLHIQGKDMMPLLENEIRKKGVTVINRTMATSLLHENGRVTGATFINVRTGEFSIIYSKAIVMTTGTTTRAFQSATCIPYHYAMFPHSTGDGQVMAYKAGAELVNLEFCGAILHPKDFPCAGLGRALMVGAKLINSRGERVMEKYSPSKLEQGVPHVISLSQAAFREVVEGRGPCYLDFTGLSPERIEQYWDGMANERPILPRYYAARGIDITKAPAEFEAGEFYTCYGSGVMIDENAKTSLEGLYMAGDAAGGLGYSAAQGAMVFGHRAGISAALTALQASHSISNQEIIDREIERVYSPLMLRNGITSRELESKIQKTMSDYAGYIRNDTSLRTAISKIVKLKTLALRVKADNFHELMKALETQNILLISEMISRAALMRTESRLNHYRSDFPKQDDKNWIKFIVIKQKDGKMNLSLRDI